MELLVEAESRCCLVHPAHRDHPGLLDVQGIQDKDLQDHLGLQDRQATANPDRKETRERWAFRPALGHIILDHQDRPVLLGLLGQLELKDQQVLLDQEDTKVNQELQDDQEALKEFQLILVDQGSRVPQVLLDLQANRAPSPPPLKCGSTSLNISEEPPMLVFKDLQVHQDLLEFQEASQAPWMTLRLVSSLTFSALVQVSV